MIEWPLVSASVNAVELIVLIWLLIHLRHSPAPYQAALLDELRKEQDILRNTVAVANREYLKDRHDSLIANDHLWEELRRIHGRLDEMRCPIGQVGCPLQGEKG